LCLGTRDDESDNAAKLFPWENWSLLVLACFKF